MAIRFIYLFYLKKIAFKHLQSHYQVVEIMVWKVPMMAYGASESSGWVYIWVGQFKSPLSWLWMIAFIKLFFWMYTDHHWIPSNSNSKTAYWNCVRSNYRDQVWLLGAVYLNFNFCFQVLWFEAAPGLKVLSWWAHLGNSEGGEFMA